MKLTSLLILLLLAQLLSAQIFTEVLGTPFDSVNYSSIAFADVNGDGHQDVLITGQKYLRQPPGIITKLYTNDGTGTFTEVLGTPFQAVANGSIAFADVNGDNHQDVLITGDTTFSANTVGVAKLYTNDGTGTFEALQVAGLAEVEVIARIEAAE